MSWIRPALLIAGKDLRLELRTKDIVTSVGLFALLVVVIASFALPTFGTGSEGIAAGVLWIAFVFAGLLGLGRSFAIESEEDCMAGLLISPAAREAVFLGKLLSNLVFTWSVEILVLPIFVVLLQVHLAGGIGLLALAAFLGTLGLTTVGTLFAAIAMNTKTREAVLPLLVLPIAVPVMIAAVKASETALAGGSSSPLRWLLLMVAYDALFLLVALATFPYVTEE